MNIVDKFLLIIGLICLVLLPFLIIGGEWTITKNTTETELNIKNN